MEVLAHSKTLRQKTRHLLELWFCSVGVHRFTASLFPRVLRMNLRASTYRKGVDFVLSNPKIRHMVANICRYTYVIIMMIIIIDIIYIYIHTTIAWMGFHWTSIKHLQNISKLNPKPSVKPSVFFRIWSQAAAGTMKMFACFVSEQLWRLISSRRVDLKRWSPIWLGRSDGCPNLTSQRMGNKWSMMWK